MTFDVDRCCIAYRDRIAIFSLELSFQLAPESSVALWASSALPSRKPQINSGPGSRLATWRVSPVLADNGWMHKAAIPR